MPSDSERADPAVLPKDLARPSGPPAGPIDSRRICMHQEMSHPTSLTEAIATLAVESSMQAGQVHGSRAPLKLHVVS